MIQPRMLFIIPIVAIVAVVLFVTLAGMFCAEYRSACVNHQNYGDVGDAFGKSIMYNDLRSAKVLSHPDVWQQIEIWMEKHRPFPYTLNQCGDWDAPIGGGGGSPTAGEPNLATYSAFYQCPAHCCYHFSFSLELEQFDSRWRVIAWKVTEGG